MLGRDANGFIIGKLPESAKPYKNLSYLVVPEAGGRSEYTPDAFNRVNTFFRNLLNLRLKLIISIIANGMKLPRDRIGRNLQISAKSLMKKLLHRSLLNLQIRCVKNLNPPNPKNIKTI